jgi:D-alanyl-D-alanine carboxypeptidase/D-alanyl-D-alanine-endopeptidase (penicillin-binding protein 4)
MKKFLTLILLVLSPHLGHSWGSLKHKIEKAIDEVNPNLTVGIQIRSFPEGNIIYAKDDQRLFIPASVHKTLITLAALIKLGPDYKFQTALSQKGPNIYLRFSGDPVFKLMDLVGLFKELKQMGVSKIRGDLIVDDSFFTLPPFPNGYSLDIMRFIFGAPVVTANINKNVVCFDLVPAETVTSPAHVNYRKDQAPYKIEGSVQTGLCTPTTGIERHHLDLEEDHIRVGGCIDFKGNPLKLCLPVKQHNLKSYLIRNIRHALKEAGVSLKGSIKMRSFNGVGSTISTHASPPLKDLVTEGMKMSDNTIMQALFLTIVSHQSPPILKWDTAGLMIRDILATYFKMDLSTIVIEEGTGGSKLNLLSPHVLSELFWKGLHDEKFGHIFADSLSIAGVDGSLEPRLKDLPPGIKFKGKTGGLSNISTLTGVIEKDLQPRLLFTIMMNSFAEANTAYTKLQDKIIHILAESL